MWKFSWSGALALALNIGCTNTTVLDQGDMADGEGTLAPDPEPVPTVPIVPTVPTVPTGVESGSSDVESDSSGKEARCLGRKPTGDPIWSFQLASGYYLGVADLAVDSNDAVIHSRGGSTSFGLPRSTTKISASGGLVYQQAFGGEVTADAKRNVYASGPFGAPIDLGLGTMTPAGIASVYLARLGLDGRTEAIRDVGFPTDQTQVEQGPIDIAVTRNGRLFAVSTLLGTVVFDAQGNERFRTPLRGSVAFDSDDRLVVSAFLQDLSGDSVIAKLDEGGCELWRVTLGVPGDFNEFTVAREVAVDAHGDIVAVGEVNGRSFLFGEEFVPENKIHFGNIPIRHGGYVIKLTANGELIWKRLYDHVEQMLGVAIDPLGSVLVSGNGYTEVGANNTALLDKLDAHGNLVWRKTGVLGNVESAGVAVATDSCGNVLWAANALIPGVDSPSYVLKLAP